MLLAIDIGNTNTVLGVFEGEQLVADFRLRTEGHATGDELGLTVTGLLAHNDIPNSDVHGLVVSSVMPSLARSVDELADRYFHVTPLVVGPGVRSGIRILTDDPRQVGADRIVNAIAAFRQYGGPAIVVDLGTATTFDAISSSGDYLGGAIAPGLLISLDALVEHAAKLNRIDPVPPPSVIGKTTAAAMQSGVMIGYVGLIEGLVTRMRAELGGEAKVVATGGLAEVIAGLTDLIDVVDPRLTLVGLRLIWELNHS